MKRGSNHERRRLTEKTGRRSWRFRFREKCPEDVYKRQAEKARHLKAVRHGNLRDLGKFLGEDRKFPSVGVFHSLFSDGQNDEILSGTGFLQAFEKVDVIAASQAAVSGDDDVAVFFAGGFPGVNGGKIQVALCDVHQSLMAVSYTHLGYSLKPIMDAMWTWGENYQAQNEKLQ